MHDLLLETTSAVLQSAPEAVGRVTSECDVWPVRVVDHPPRKRSKQSVVSVMAIYQQSRRFKVTALSASSGCSRLLCRSQDDQSKTDDSDNGEAEQITA